MRKGFPKGLKLRVQPVHRLEDGLLEFFKDLGIPQSEWDDPALDIANTPRRITKMLRNELLVSYQPGALADLKSRFTKFPSDGRDAMVLEGPIDFHSTCAHHLLPFSGEAYVGYIPGASLVGASKLPRVVEHYARMLQIQERLARQTASFIHGEAGARLVIVLMSASHLCMRCRGVRQQRTRMVTTAIEPNPGTWTSEEEIRYRGVLNEFYAQLSFTNRQ